MQGIRLVNQMHQKGQSSVVSKHISVRAENFSGAANNEVDPRLATLNQQRDKLPVSVPYDFTIEAPNPSVLYRWSDLRKWSKDHQGLRIHADGFDTWESAGICTLHPIVGDFDITTEFEAGSMEKPRTDDQTAVFLQLESTDKRRSQFNCVFNLVESGFKEAACQLRQTSEKNELTYRDIGSFSTRSVSALRMARRGKQWTALARLADSGEERIIAESEVSDMPISRARLLLHTGGANRTSEILLKKFEIHATEYAPDSKTPATSPRQKRAPWNRCLICSGRQKFVRHIR